MLKKVFKKLLWITYMASILCLLVMGLSAILADIVGLGLVDRIFYRINISHNLLTHYVTFALCFCLATISSVLLKKVGDDPFLIYKIFNKSWQNPKK